ncbi:hypothetical protein HRbin09_02008 [bacterium HR09]|nr:hypothetical protein HRbin09_02008 [bacterium HR09]
MDGNPHDRQNANGAHQKRNAGNPGNRHGHDVHDPAQGVQHFVLGGHGEVLLPPVASGKQLLDTFHHSGNGFRRYRRDVNFRELRSPKQGHGGSHRHVAGIVQIKAQEPPLGLHDPHHQKRPAANAHPLPQGRGGAKKLPGQFWAQHRHRRLSVCFNDGHVAPLRHVEAPHLRSFRAGAVNVHAAPPVFRLHPRLPHHHRRELLHPGDPAKGFRVLQGELLHPSPKNAGKPKGLDLSRVDGNEVGAKLRELAEDEAAGSLP